MKIDFDGIQAFVLVAELGGFSRAADRAAPDPDGAHAAHPEARGLPRGAAARPHDAVGAVDGGGRDFLPQARRLVDEMTSAVGRLKDMSRLGKGNVTIASIPTMAHHTLPGVIRGYAEEHPGNRIRIIESNASEVAAPCCSTRRSSASRSSSSATPTLVEEPVLREPFMFFCRDEHPLSDQKVVTWERAGRGGPHPGERPVGQSRAARLPTGAKAAAPARHVRGRAPVDGDRARRGGRGHRDPAVLDHPGRHLSARAPDPAREAGDRPHDRADPQEKRDAVAGRADLHDILSQQLRLAARAGAKGRSRSSH